MRARYDAYDAARRAREKARLDEIHARRIAEAKAEAQKAAEAKSAAEIIKADAKKTAEAKKLLTPSPAPNRSNNSPSSPALGKRGRSKGRGRGGLREAVLTHSSSDQNGHDILSSPASSSSSLSPVPELNALPSTNSAPVLGPAARARSIKADAELRDVYKPITLRKQVTPSIDWIMLIYHRELVEGFRNLGLLDASGSGLASASTHRKVH